MAAGVVEVELLGVARLLARQEAARVPLEAPLPLPVFLGLLADQVPALVGTVFSESGEFLGGHVLSRGGTEFIQDADAVIHPGDRLMLLSLSAGG